MIIYRGRVTGLSDVSLARFVARVRQAISLQGLVNILITSSGEMKSLNRRFRGKDEPTDVLSFPSGAIDDCAGNDLAGEIAISIEIARENGKRLGHSTPDEIKILILHGMLHLAGYDHEADLGKMALEEQRLRLSLGLPSGLIERNTANSKAIRRSPQPNSKITRGVARLKR